MRDAYSNGIKKWLGKIDRTSKRRIGTWYFFSREGQITSYGRYNGGVRVGTWVEFDWTKGKVLNTTFLAVGQRKYVERIRKRHLRNIPSPVSEAIQCIIDLTDRIAL